MNLTERAVLVSLVIHMWTNQKSDSKAAKVVEEKFQLEKSEDRYMKVLINSFALQEVRRLGSRLRQTHYRYTMPWQDDGVRILPSKLFMTYMQEMNQLKNEFATAVDDLITQYPKHIEAARGAKKDLFNEREYPSETVLRAMFGVETNFLPFPSAHDFRIDIDDDGALAKLKAEADAAYTKATKDAMQAYLGSLMSRLDKMAPMINMIQQSSLDALKGQVALLLSMNLLDNPVVVEIHGQLDGMLNLYTAEEIRTNKQSAGHAYNTITHCLHLFKNA